MFEQKTSKLSRAGSTSHPASLWSARAGDPPTPTFRCDSTMAPSTTRRARPITPAESGQVDQVRERVVRSRQSSVRRVASSSSVACRAGSRGRSGRPTISTPASVAASELGHTAGCGARSGATREESVHREPPRTSRAAPTATDSVTSSLWSQGEEQNATRSSGLQDHAARGNEMGGLR